MKKIFIFVLIVMSLSSPSFALQTEKYTQTVAGATDTMILDSPGRTLKDLVKNYVNVPQGGLDWKILGATKEQDIEGKTKEGYDFQYYKPAFTPEVRALDGKEVTIRGFMFPLDATDGQKEFLFGPFPIGCPFHYHVSPSLVIEVHTGKKPVKFSYDPVTLRGRLVLVDKDPENSTFYRLMDARTAD